MNRRWHLANMVVSAQATRKMDGAPPQATSRWNGSINHVRGCLISYDEFNKRHACEHDHFRFRSGEQALENANDGGESDRGEWSRGTEFKSSPFLLLDSFISMHIHTLDIKKVESHHVLAIKKKGKPRYIISHVFSPLISAITPITPSEKKKN